MAAPTNRRVLALETAAERTARMLVRKPEVKVIVAGDGASYEWRTKTLRLPAFSSVPDDPRLLDAFRGEIDHECGHVEFTDFSQLEGRHEIWKQRYGAAALPRIAILANAYEDYWMEHAMARLHKGSGRHFAVKNAYVGEKTGGARTCDPMFVPSGGSQAMGAFGAFTQAVLRVPRGMVRLEDVHPEIRALMARCDAAIRQGWAATDTAGACDAAEATWKALQLASEPPPQPPEPESGKPEPEEGDSEPQDGQQGDSGAGQDQGDPGDAEDDDGASSGDDGEESEAGGSGDAEPEDGQGGSEPGDGSSAPQDAPETAEDEEGGGDSPEEGNGEPGPSGAPESGTESGAEPEGATEGDAPVGTDEPGGGVGYTPLEDDSHEVAARAISGEFGELETDAQIIAAAFRGQGAGIYTVHPAAQAMDKVISYKDRRPVAEANALREVAGPRGKKLASLLRGAVQASRQSLLVGGLEDGDDLDEDAIPSIALGESRRDIFASTFRRIEESSFVTVLVDCSGSMGDSTPTWRCEQHGKQDGSCCKIKACTSVVRRIVESEAGYAAITAATLHDALRAVRVPHAVLGYTTTVGPRSAHNPQVGSGLLWSRSTSALAIHVFVDAPGLYDDGAALAYVTGRANNLDGESVLWAARYTAEHARTADRAILMVVADGLPAGADDYRLNCPHLVASVERVARAGIEVYGIGVGVDGHRDRFHEFYPDRKGEPGRAPTGCTFIPSGQGLDDHVLREITALLTRGYGRSRKGAA